MMKWKQKITPRGTWTEPRYSVLTMEGYLHLLLQNHENRSGLNAPGAQIVRFTIQTADGNVCSGWEVAE